MIAVDTNVLIRFAIVDNQEQSRRVRTFFAARSAADPALVSVIVLAELWWTMTTTFKRSQAEVREFVRGLATLDGIVLSHHDLVTAALNRTESGAGFTDALVSEMNREFGARETVTFDKKAAKHAGMTLLELSSTD